MKKIFLLNFIIVLLFVLFNSDVNAAEKVWTPPDLQISFPQKVFSQQVDCTTNERGVETCKVPWISEYIAAIYKYAVGIVGILAVVVMMVGGAIWITAGGNASSVGEAKSWITGALTGLVLVLASYTILYIINPDLTNLKFIEIKTVKVPEATLAEGTCVWSQYDTTNENAKSCSALNGPHQKWEKSDKNFCSKNEEYEKNVYWDCCCPVFSADWCPSGIPCLPCYNCIASQVPCKYPGRCFISADLEAKLEAAYAINNKIIITEPWPPTVTHLSTCHQNGTCVDLDVSPNSESVNDICGVYSALTQAGLDSLTYEHPSCLNNEQNNVYTKQCGVPCKYYSTSIGSSFHVNQ